MKNINQLLAKILAERNLIPQEQLAPLVVEAEKTGQPLSVILNKNGLMAEEKSLTILAQELHIPFVNLKTMAVDKSVIERIPVKFISYYKFAPLKIEHHVLTVAVPSPMDLKVQDEIRTHLGYAIEMVLAPHNDIMELLNRHYGLAADTVQKIISKAPRKEAPASVTAEGKIEDIEQLVEEESVIKLVNQIIFEAYKRRATDIHIEPYRGKVKLRYRIDGVLHNAPVPAEMAQFYDAILSRMKIISNLNIIEHRLPQDGRAIVRVQDKILDLRISCVPTPYTESLVIRILPTEMLFSLEKLGLSPRDLKAFESLVKKPHGIILVTGPTGSGKTTTLYTCLSQINTDQHKIITIEDPIEYELEGITQMQVAPEIDFTFARALRSVLRHDPDVIMVGEIRDPETAQIAIQVALTGHLVFSTLHTNDAASGVVRLTDIGVEPYLIASSVEAFVAQRLVRVNCPHCKMEDAKVPKEVKKQIADDLGLSSMEDKRFYRGKGCNDCNATGFWGRTAIYEILLVSEAIKNLILKRAPAGEIKKVAMQQGMQTLRQAGWQKVLEGVTTPEEIMNLTQKEEEKSESVSAAAAPAAPTQRQPLPTSRRVYVRLATKVNVSYKVVKTTERLPKKFQTEQFSTTEDISAGGLVLTANEPFPMGPILEVKIELPDGEPPIECLAKVVRVEEIESNAVYRIAVCFLDMPSAQRVRLDKYVEEEVDT